MTKFAKQALASEKHATWFEQSGVKTEMLLDMYFMDLCQHSCVALGWTSTGARLELVSFHAKPVSQFTFI